MRVGLVRCAALVHHADVHWDLRERARDGLIQGFRSLAAAEH